MSAILITSLIISGILIDYIGRKKVIIWKVIGFLTLLTVIMTLGYAKKTSGLTAISLYFINMSFATFSFDLQIMGFESLCKYDRENYIVTTSATRIVGVGLICIFFYFAHK